MPANFRPIEISPTIASLQVDSDAAIISEGLVAIALPLGLFLGVLVRKTRNRRLLKYQIELLERLWEKSSDRV